MGLRALYFALAGIMQLFHYLPYGLSFILAFVGIKMLLVDIYKIPIGMALRTVAGVLVISVIACSCSRRSRRAPPQADPRRPGTTELPPQRLPGVLTREHTHFTPFLPQEKFDIRQRQRQPATAEGDRHGNWGSVNFR
jgi:hypothetical protein